MPEQLTDEQILNIEDDAPATEGSEAPEATAPADSSPSEFPSEPTQETSPTPETEATKKEPVEKSAEQESPSPLSELFPKGEAQAKDALAKSNELDAIDAALHSGDHAGMADVAMKAFEQGPEAYPQLLGIGLDVLKQNAPELHAQLISSLVGEELRGKEVGRALEYIREAAQSRPEQVPELLTRLAKFFEGYGLAPQDSSAETASWQEYRTAAAEGIHNFLDTDIRRALPAEFNAAPKDLQDELVKAIHFAVQDRVRQDRNLGMGVQNALKGGLTRESGVAAVNLLASKARAFVSGAVKQVLAQYGSALPAKQVTTQAQPKVTAKPAPTSAERPPSSLAEARARGMNMAEILKATLSEQEQTDAANPLTQEEANSMAFEDILNSARSGQTRKTWRPENIFDEVSK